MLGARRTTLQSRNALRVLPVQDLVRLGELHLDAIDKNLVFDAGGVAAEIRLLDDLKPGFWQRTRSKTGVVAGAVGTSLFALDVATTGGAVTILGAMAGVVGGGGFLSSGFDYRKYRRDEMARQVRLEELKEEAGDIEATRAHLRQALDVLRPKITSETSTGDPTMEPARRATTPPETS